MASTKAQTFLADNFNNVASLDDSLVKTLHADGAFLVAEGNVEHFAKKMVSLARRATRNGMSAFALTVHGYTEAEVAANSPAVEDEETGELTADDKEIVRFVTQFRHGIK